MLSLRRCTLKEHRLPPRVGATAIGIMFTLRDREAKNGHVGYIQSSARLPPGESDRLRCCLQKFSMAKLRTVQLGSGLVRRHCRRRKTLSISALGCFRG